MKKLILTASAISMLAFGAMVSAEQQLSFGEMDGVTAGGFADGYAAARAHGVTSDTYTRTVADTFTVDELQIPGQVGKIDVVRSYGDAESRAFATGSFADASGYAHGDTEGTYNSDVIVTSLADADTTGTILPGSRVSAYSFNESLGSASEIVLGRTSYANSSTSSVAIIGN
jgi:hypothetical protein